MMTEFDVELHCRPSRYTLAMHVTGSFDWTRHARLDRVGHFDGSRPVVL